MSNDECIIMGHGGGGRLSSELVGSVWQDIFSDPALATLPDAAVLPAEGERIAFTTDGYVVKPLSFPGGDIGRMAICGTVNDLATSGARASYISLGAIIEEGFEIERLKTFARSAAAAASEAGVRIVTGDTKVVERGAADGLFLTTAGVGFFDTALNIAPNMARAGDVVLVSGFLGDHGIALMAKREGLSFQTPVVSDCAPINGIVKALLDNNIELHAMRDPTRGGIATTLNEIASGSGVSIKLNESALPIRKEVKSACKMLGLDPLTIANEGKLVVVASKDTAEDALKIMRDCKYGADAQIIGIVKEKGAFPLSLVTAIGGERIVDVPRGEALPRIC